MTEDDFEGKLFNLQKNVNFMEINPNQEEIEWVEFNKLDLIKKIHPSMKLEDLQSIYNSLISFYLLFVYDIY